MVGWRARLSGISGHEHYDWSTPGIVRATVQESDIAVPGGIWRFQVSPGADGDSHITVVFDRSMHGPKGRPIAVFLSLFAKRAFRTNLLKALKSLENRQNATQTA